MGPGVYDVDRADGITKTKVTTTVNMSSSPGRDVSFNRKQGSDVSPGQYDDRNYEFGSKSKGFTIGERREQRTETTLGPGAYDVDKADAVTKTKTMTTVRMGASSSPGQIETTTNKATTILAQQQHGSFTNV